MQFKDLITPDTRSSFFTLNPSVYENIIEHLLFLNEKKFEIIQKTNIRSVEIVSCLQDRLVQSYLSYCKFIRENLKKIKPEFRETLLLLKNEVFKLYKKYRNYKLSLDNK